MSTGSGDERIRGRLEEAHRWLREHHAGIAPDAGFASRVAARLGRDPAEELGRAALRLLPAAVALALVLVWAAARTGPDSPGSRAGEDGFDVVAWVYGEEAGGR